MTRIPELPDRVSVNVRAEMAAQKRTAIELADLLGIGHRAALRRVNGELAYSLGETAKVADWLGVSVAALMSPRNVEAVAS